MGQISKFFKSLAVSFTKPEIEFVRRFLNPQEQILFYRMPVVDQKHALEISQILETRAKSNSQINLNILIKAALLHDLGKCFYPFTLSDRVFGSILFRVLRPVYDQLALKGEKQNRRNFSRMIYVHHNHPKLGAALARESGVEEACCAIIENHHQTNISGSPELNLLWEVDNEV